MRLDRIITLRVARPLKKLGRASSGSCIPVLMYHSISEDAQPELAPYYKTATSPAVFERQVRWLTENGYRSLKMGDALKALKTGKKPEKLVVITFDDGFRDFHTSAFPILKRHGQTATMYLPTGFISNERRSFKGRECMTWKEIRELKGQGIEFGSHTVSHPKLYELSWQQVEDELAVSKAQIERELEQGVDGFAYPFAFPQQDHDFTVKFTDLLRQSGYRNCATTIVGRVRPSDDDYSLKRLPVNNCDDLALFAAKLEGAYDWFGTPQNWSKQIRRLLGKKPASRTGVSTSPGRLASTTAVNDSIL